MTDDSHTARGLIAAILATIFGAAIVGLFFLTPNAGTEKYLVLLIGCLITLITTVVNFYFGTSSGAKTLSATQSALLTQQTPQVAPPQIPVNDPSAVPSTEQTMQDLVDAAKKQGLVK